MITRARLAEIVRYLITGALGASINVGLSIALTEYLGLYYLVSLFVSSMIVIVLGFFLNRSWTFRSRGASVLAEFCRYALVNGINVVIGMAACAFLVQEMHIPYSYAIAIVAFVFAPVTYLVHRAWTFGLAWLSET